MARSLGNFYSRTEQSAAIVVFMIANGWTNDGAPTKTILKSAADTEGRRCYVLIADNGSYAHLIDLSLGDSRNGDTVELNGVTGGNIGSIPWEDGKDFWMFATDHWFSCHGMGDSANYVFSIFGLLVCEDTVGDYPSPLFLATARTPANANRVINFNRYGSFGNWYVRDVANNAWVWGAWLPILFFSSGSVGVKTLGNVKENRLVGIPVAGSARLCFRVWFRSYTTDEFTAGYIKDAYFVTGISGIDDHFGQDTPVIIGNYLYYQIGNSIEAGLVGGGDGGNVFVKGETF